MTTNKPLTEKQAAALQLLKNAGVPVPVEVPHRHGSRFCVHPCTAQVLVNRGLAEWVRSEFVRGTLHVKYIGQ